MKTEHTKGPWRVIENGKGLNRHCVGTENTAPVQAVICEINTKSVGTNDEIRLANARLIAAAPDLLEALKSALSVIEDLPYPANYSAKDIRSAINKVEGNA